MKGIDLSEWFLIAGGGLVMAMVFLRGIGVESVQLASTMTEERRKRHEKDRADNAAAEAAGKAASLEPLALNPDGTIEEPILGVLESR